MTRDEQFKEVERLLIAWSLDCIDLRGREFILEANDGCVVRVAIGGDAVGIYKYPLKTDRRWLSSDWKCCFYKNRRGEMWEWNARHQLWNELTHKDR